MADGGGVKFYGQAKKEGVSEADCVEEREEKNERQRRAAVPREREGGKQSERGTRILPACLDLSKYIDKGHVWSCGTS